MNSFIFENPQVNFCSPRSATDSLMNKSDIRGWFRKIKLITRILITLLHFIFTAARAHLQRFPGNKPLSWRFATLRNVCWQLLNTNWLHKFVNTLQFPWRPNCWHLSSSCFIILDIVLPYTVHQHASFISPRPWLYPALVLSQRQL